MGNVVYTGKNQNPYVGEWVLDGVQSKTKLTILDWKEEYITLHLIAEGPDMVRETDGTAERVEDIYVFNYPNTGCNLYFESLQEGKIIEMSANSLCDGLYESETGKLQFVRK